MAQLAQAFDPNTVEPDRGGRGGPHPKGIFEFEVHASEVKPTSNGKGTMLALTLVGTGSSDAPEDNRDRKVFCNINIQNESAQAQTIGQSQLSALCAAIGLTEQLSDSDQLHYRPFWAEIGHERRMKKGPTGKYDQPDYNDDGSPKMSAVVKRFMFEDGDAPSTPEGKAAPQAAPSPPPPPPRQAAPGGRTWQRR